MTDAAEPELMRLSEAAAETGIPGPTLKMLADEGLLAGSVRGRGGHIYLRRDATPTWTHCITLIARRRDRYLQRAAHLVTRLERELEAVRNDIAEAREHSREPLGIDLLSLGSRTRVVPPGDGAPTVDAILQQFVRTRWEIQRWDDALQDAYLASPDGDAPAGAEP